MHLFRTSLATRIFLAIAATSILIVAIMALLVGLSMRDGFAKYLLRSELARLDPLEQALVTAYDPESPGWPTLASDRRVWGDFLHANATPPNAGLQRPGDQDRPEIGAPPRPEHDTIEGMRPPPPRFSPQGGPPPGGPPGPDGPRLTNRLSLLAPDGSLIAGSTDRTGFYEQRPICADTECSGDTLLGYLGLHAPEFSGTSSDTFFLHRQYTSLALAALIAVVVSAVAAAIVARKILTPIRQLELGAKRMASGDYSARIAQDGTDELGQLIGHYNVLAATLERTDKAEREWISNTSHELQTPLANLRAQIEALQDSVREPDEDTLAAMHAAMMRLSQLVQDIKILSHSREAALSTAYRTEDLTAIVRETVRAAQPQLDSKQIALDLDLPGPTLLACDKLRIGQVVDNLVQNSIRYSDAPGFLRIRVGKIGNMVRLIVDDTPPAPLDADLPRLFDRFFRGESSRARAFGGSGLGLSVCAAIVKAHGGTITAGLSDLGGLRITVWLPKERP